MEHKEKLPKSCPCLGHKRFDCSIHDRVRGSEYCYGEAYVNCPAFSSWFWFTVAKKRKEIVKKFNIQPAVTGGSEIKIEISKEGIK